MIDFIGFFADGLNDIVTMLDQTQLFGVVSLFDFMFGAIVLLLVISVFWKGVGT